MDADEIIVTASGTLCRPVCEVDGVAVGGKDTELVGILREKIIGDFIAKTNV
jgi:D-alanine transaminase